MPERLTPKEMFEEVKAAYPELSNSKVRRMVQAYNAATPQGCDFTDWLRDPTGRTAVNRVHQQHPDGQMWRRRHFAAVYATNQRNNNTKEGPVDLMTTEEAAAFLHVPIATLRWWVQRDEAPPSAKIGRRRMFRRADLEKFVNDKFNAA